MYLTTDLYHFFYKPFN